MTYPADYAKGDVTRTAHTPADAAKLEFNGFKRVVDAENVDYRDLQKQAKELGIPANGSAEELAERINAELESSDADADDTEVDSHEGDQSVDTVGTVNVSEADFR